MTSLYMHVTFLAGQYLHYQAAQNLFIGENIFKGKMLPCSRNIFESQNDWSRKGCHFNCSQLSISQS